MFEKRNESAPQSEETHLTPSVIEGCGSPYAFAWRVVGSPVAQDVGRGNSHGKRDERVQRHTRRSQRPQARSETFLTEAGRSRRHP